MRHSNVWQMHMVEDLRRLLEPNEAVRAVLVHGSCAQPQLQRDAWSDVDVVIVVANGELERFFPTTAWLTPLGEVYAINQSSRAVTRTTRVCFTDFRRLDCVVVEEADVAEQRVYSLPVPPLGCNTALRQSLAIWWTSAWSSGSGLGMPGICPVGGTRRQHSWVRLRPLSPSRGAPQLWLAPASWSAQRRVPPPRCRHPPLLVPLPPPGPPPPDLAR